MIYLFSGDDAKNKLSAYEKFVKTATKGLDIFQISRNNFNKLEIESLYSGSGLFFTKCVVIFSGILENEDNREFILERLENFTESQNDFIFLESKLNKPILTAFKIKGVEINNFELPKAEKEKFNNFLLANAFGAKDKLNLWIYFRQAMDKGVGIDELNGVLFWKIKDMLLKKNFVKFSEVELKKYLSKLAFLLPEARGNSLDEEIAFERFLLESF
jgi:hypothetical protein